MLVKSYSNFFDIWQLFTGHTVWQSQSKENANKNLALMKLPLGETLLKFNYRSPLL